MGGQQGRRGVKQGVALTLLLPLGSSVLKPNLHSLIFYINQPSLESIQSVLKYFLYSSSITKIITATLIEMLQDKTVELRLYVTQEPPLFHDNYTQKESTKVEHSTIVDQIRLYQGPR